MTVDNWLAKSSSELSKVGIATAQLDCLVLLEDELGIDRSLLITRSRKISGKSLAKLDRQIEQRSQHIPLAYIRGKTEFYGREFLINKDVLEPRPESETMIELLKSLKLPPKLIILDLGTGCGALAITAKLELSKSTVLASDIDKKCLAVARQNAQKHNVNLNLVSGDLLEPIKDKIAVILANLPYVPDKFKLNQAAENEPKTAIFGGPDGLDLYRQLFEQIKNLKYNPTFVLTESLPFQHTNLAKIAEKAGYKLTKTDGFIQVFVEHNQQARV